MKLYKLTVPIRNYERNGIFEQDIFINADKCPRIENWLSIITTCHNRDTQYPEYTGDWQEVIDCLVNCKEFPQLYGNCVQTNTFVETSYGNKPLTISIQETFTISNGGE